MNTFLLYLFFRWEDTSFHSSVSTFVVVGGMKRDFIYQNRLHWNAVESRLNDKINANPMHYDTLFANRGFRIKKAFTRPPTNEPTEKKNVYHKGNNLDHNTKYGSNYTHSQFFLVFSGNFYVINFFLVQHIARKRFTKAFDFVMFGIQYIEFAFRILNAKPTLSGQFSWPKNLYSQLYGMWVCVCIERNWRNTKNWALFYWKRNI